MEDPALSDGEPETGPGGGSGAAAPDAGGLRAFLLRSRVLTETLQSLRFRWRHRGRGPVVLVHQMARVGSATVFHALRRALPGNDYYHTHYLHPDTIAYARRQFDRAYLVTGRAGLHREYLAARLLRQRIERGVEARWRVVSLVRDPVARTVSAFFKHFPWTFPELGLRFLDTPDNVPRLIELFLDESDFEHAFTLGWFDREVRDVFGIDVYDTPFPHEAGRVVLEGRLADLLVLRLEDLDAIGPAALGAFFGVPPIPLSAANRSRDASYHEVFRRFTEALRPPAAFLDRMYESRFARHFYRPAELAEFRGRWEGAPSGKARESPGEGTVVTAQ